MTFRENDFSFYDIFKRIDGEIFFISVSNKHAYTYISIILIKQTLFKTF